MLENIIAQMLSPINQESENLDNACGIPFIEINNSHLLQLKYFDEDHKALTGEEDMEKLLKSWPQLLDYMNDIWSNYCKDYQLLPMTALIWRHCGNLLWLGHIFSFVKQLKNKYDTVLVKKCPEDYLDWFFSKGLSKVLKHASITTQKNNGQFSTTFLFSYVYNKKEDTLRALEEDLKNLENDQAISLKENISFFLREYDNHLEFNSEMMEKYIAILRMILEILEERKLLHSENAQKRIEKSESVSVIEEKIKEKPTPDLVEKKSIEINDLLSEFKHKAPQSATTIFLELAAIAEKSDFAHIIQLMHEYNINIMDLIRLVREKS